MRWSGWTSPAATGKPRWCCRKPSGPRHRYPGLPGTQPHQQTPGVRRPRLHRAARPRDRLPRARALRGTRPIPRPEVPGHRARPAEPRGRLPGHRKGPEADQERPAAPEDTVRAVPRDRVRADPQGDQPDRRPRQTIRRPGTQTHARAGRRRPGTLHRGTVPGWYELLAIRTIAVHSAATYDRMAKLVRSLPPAEHRWSPTSL